MYLLGIDLVDVGDVERSMAQFGHRYQDRLLSHDELQAFDEVGGSAVSLAELVAAKEATMKVLHPGSRPLDWRWIELHRAGPGKFALRLADGAAELAQAAGIMNIDVSLAHGAGHAVALAIARVGPARVATAAGGEQ